MSNLGARRVLALAAATMMSASLLAGCGGSTSTATSESAQTTETTSSDTASSDKSSSTNASATGEEVQKDVVNVGIEADPADLSPFGTATTGRTCVIEEIYETLGYIDTDGAYVAVMAKDYELSDNETKLTFHLYENIYDTAGNHITASDVVFSYNSKANNGNLYNIAFINDCEAVDEYTVQFNLTPPLNLTNIANLVNNLYVVSEAAYNASADGMVTDGIVSTGPYKVDSYQGGYLLTLTKNEDYWQIIEDTAPRSRANVDTINYYILAESNQRSMALESGTVDMCWSVASADLDKFDEGGEQSGNYWIYEDSDNLSYVLIFNAADGHQTSDENLRKAIGYTINNEVVTQSIFGTHGEPNYDIARSSVNGFVDEWLSEDNFYNYDIEKAKELVAQSGYNGEELTLLCQTSTDSTNMAAILQGFAAQAGINLKIDAVDSAVASTYFADESSWDIYITQSAAETYAVQPWMRHLDNRSSGTTTGFLKDDELQSLLETASNLDTSNQDAINACHDYIADHGIMYGLANQHSCYVVPNDVKEVVLGYKKEVLPGACTYVE